VLELKGLIRSISIQKVCKEWSGAVGEGLGEFERDDTEEEEEDSVEGEDSIEEEDSVEGDEEERVGEEEVEEEEEE
jgi:hypothetical protein